MKTARIGLRYGIPPKWPTIEIGGTGPVVVQKNGPETASTLLDRLRQRADWLRQQLPAMTEELETIEKMIAAVEKKP